MAEKPLSIDSEFENLSKRYAGLSEKEIAVLTDGSFQRFISLNQIADICERGVDQADALINQKTESTIELSAVIDESINDVKDEGLNKALHAEDYAETLASNKVLTLKRDVLARTRDAAIAEIKRYATANPNIEQIATAEKILEFKNRGLITDASKEEKKQMILEQERVAATEIDKAMTDSFLKELGEIESGEIEKMTLGNMAEANKLAAERAEQRLREILSQPEYDHDAQAA
jgi:hypothetical protein